MGWFKSFKSFKPFKKFKTKRTSMFKVVHEIMRFACILLAAVICVFSDARPMLAQAPTDKVVVEPVLLVRTPTDVDVPS